MATSGKVSARPGDAKSGSGLQAIKFNKDKADLTILDQLAIPEKKRYIRINSIQEGYNAISKMFVRGGPAIAIVGIMSVAIQMKKEKFGHKSEMRGFAATQSKYIAKSRPTAANMLRTAEWFIKIVEEECERSDNMEEIKDGILAACEELLMIDVDNNQKLGDHGARALITALNLRMGSKIKVLTHSNTGSLASGGYGTALGVIRRLNEMEKLDHVYFTETRPYLQGSRLTAFELQEDGIPATLISDSMAAYLLKVQQVSVIVVGGDRIAANGDTAGKIGTYMLSILAKHHEVPFYVAALVASVDLKCKTGGSIQIEERPPDELCVFRGIRVAPEGTKVWNPSYDITPAQLIAGIITEHGTFAPSGLEKAVKPILQQN